MANKKNKFPDKLDTIQVSTEQRSDLDRLLNFGFFKDKSTDARLITRAFNLLCFYQKQESTGSTYSYYPKAIGIAEILIKHMKPDAALLAALLIHDPVNYLRWPLKYINDTFGSDVAYLVEGMVKYRLLYELNCFNQPNERENLQSYIADDIRNSHILFSHLLFTLQTLPDESVESQRDIANSVIKIIAPLAYELKLVTAAGEIENHSFRIIDPTGFKFISRKINENKEVINSFVNDFLEPFEALLKKSKLQYTLKGWPRLPCSYYRDMIGQKKSFESIYDHYEIECELSKPHTAEDCRRVFSLLKSGFTTICDRHQDLLSIPADDGLASLHTAVLTDKGLEVGIHIYCQ